MILVLLIDKTYHDNDSSEPAKIKNNDPGMYTESVIILGGCTRILGLKVRGEAPAILD